MGKRKTESVPPGSNWLALQKSLPSKGNKPKRQKQSGGTPSATSPAFPRGGVAEPASSSRASASRTVLETGGTDDANKEIKQLRKLVLGMGTAGEDLVGEPGRYLALDCEMVGVGEDGKESSLARASIVDYHGRVVLDEFVQQRERVTDYRTQYSGVRPEDMIHAKPFGEIQSRVAELLAPADRILVGHALSNDLAALLLTHPASRTRDTQLYAGRKPHTKPGAKGKHSADDSGDTQSIPTLWEKYRTPHVALKRLAKEELGVDIQAGEHSSVTDARAAMAIYRLHKRAWDASIPIAHLRGSAGIARHAPDTDGDSENSGTESLGRPKRKRQPSGSESFPGGGRRGVSAGLSTIVRRGAHKSGTNKTGVYGTKSLAGTRNPQHSHVGKEKWWQSLGETDGTSGSKGQLRLA
ncbi:3'-5' exonuclease [Ceratobasidium sp. 394]|nr:3'-5' exonuclease [Ceratobasidium sp. 394]